MAQAIWYEGASLAIFGGKTAFWPAGTPVTARSKVSPSRGSDLQGKRLPQKYGHKNVVPDGSWPSSLPFDLASYA